MDKTQDNASEEEKATEGEPQKPSMPKTPPWLETDFRNSEDQNLVPLFEQDPKAAEWLAAFAERLIHDKKADEQSCEGYYQRLAQAVELYLGMSKEFDYGPAEGERKPCLPTLAKIVQRIVSRTLSVVLNTEPVGVPTGEEDQPRALRVAQHIAWEKRSKHPEWKPTMAVSILRWALYGSEIRKVTWDTLERKKEIYGLTCEELIMPYTDKDTTPNLKNVERITEIIDLPRWRVKKLGNVGFFHGVDKLFDKNAEKKPTTVKYGENRSPMRKVIDELQGTSPQTDRKGTMYRFLERQSWEELPGDENNPRRISCVIEESTRRVVRFVIKEREDPKDRVRYQNELLEKALEFENSLGIANATGQSPEAQAEAKARVKPPLTTAVYDYHHYSFSPNPKGVYGLGAWVFVGQLNEIANELAGEDLLGKRIANVAGSTGIVDDNLTLDKGELQLKYGKFVRGSAANGNIAQSIFTLPFAPPRADVMTWVDKIDQEAQSVMSSSDYQSGMPGPSHETAAAAKLRVAAGNTAITQAIESFLVPLAVEYQTYARLNATYMSDDEYFMVVEPNPEKPGTTKRVPVGISRADYESDFDITFDADVRLRVDPGLGDNALSAYQLVMADPDLQGEMNIRMAARKKALKALECADIANMLPDEVPPPPPPEPMSQENENALFMEEKDHPVLDDDDHEYHTAKMGEFRAQGMYDELTPTGKQLFDRHERGHKAKMYLQAAQTLAGTQDGTQPPGPGVPPEASPGRPM